MKRVRIGVDVGGTFTDVFLLDEESGGLAVQKIPSTPRDPSEGIIEAMELMLRQNNVPVAAVVYFAHGSTVATNTLLQHRGAKVGLITTVGFKDLLEIGRQTRPHLYDLQTDKPEPLVSRDLRLEVRERVYADGEILIPLRVEDLEQAVAKLKDAEVEAVVICYLHSFRNPKHEQISQAIVQQEMPNVYLSTSHEILSEFREFERFNTTVVNAYLGPAVSGYVQNLGHRLQGLGIRCRPYMTQSNGGIISLDVAARYTCRTVFSGPSSGVIGACHVAAQAGFFDLITLDMGGTSTDVSLVAKGRPSLTSQRAIGGYPVKTPMVDIHTIGAGGGSIGWIDSGGLLKVGPQSAGADPGPACYAKGGGEATVTDANVVLGVLNPEYLLGGHMKIEAERSRDAVQRLAKRMGLNELQTAKGIITVVVANMMRAVRVISVQRGYDPRDYVLVSYGGAGSLHSGWLARELKMKRTFVPLRPGLLCAFGLLVTDMRSDFLLTRIMHFGKLDLTEVNEIYEGLEKHACLWLEAEGVAPSQRLLRRTVDMRYVGQNYELSTPVPGGFLTSQSLSAILQEFYRIHDQTYGYAVPGEATELVTFRVEALGLIAKATLPESAPAGSHPPKEAILDYRQVCLDEEWVDTPVFAREQLFPGNVVKGPAIIEQMDATTLILPGQRGMVDRFLNLLVEEDVVD